MKPLQLFENPDRSYSLILATGTTAADVEIAALGHEPNGEFWLGVTTFLFRDHPELEGRMDFDPEAGTFCAYGSDRAALESLGALLARLACDPAAMRTLVEAAHAAGHDFDD